jgi:radical SAM superfamily enzyme YgiQ (UPF0313 family)
MDAAQTAVSARRPSLALLEPIVLEQLTDRPHLGCAMVIASCRAGGHAVRLVPGQTRWLRWLMLDDAAELWELLHGASDEQLAPFDLARYRRSLRGRSSEDFASELAAAYGDVITAGRPRGCFNGHRVENLRTLYSAFARFAAYAATTLRRDDFGVVRRTLDDVRAAAPPAVGFSLQGRFDPLTRMLRHRLRADLGVPVMIGGPLTSFIEKSEYGRVLAEEEVDYLVVGPAEHALPSLLDALQAGESPEGVPGVYWSHDGQVVGAEPKVIADLDALPSPDYTQFELDRYVAPRLVLGIETARGCTWRRCAFCAHHSALQGTYNTYDVERVVRDIARLRDRHGCQDFALHDLELPPGRARVLSNALIDAGIEGISLTAYGRLLPGYRSEDLWRLMRHAGFVSFEWGLESGCQEVLDSMDKGTDVDVSGEVLETAARHGVANQCFLLFGFPGETRAAAEETLAFVRRHRHAVSKLSMNELTIHPGSPLGRDPQRWGLREVDGYLEATSGMTRGEAHAFFRKASAAYHLDPREFTSPVVRCIPQDNEGRMIHALSVAYGLLARDVALERLDAGEWPAVHPLLLGDLVVEDDDTTWRPIDVGEPPLVNALRRPPDESLGWLEAAAWALADGRISFGALVQDAAKAASSRTSRSSVETTLVKFVRGAIQAGHAIAFARSWNGGDAARRSRAGLVETRPKDGRD